MGSVRVSSYSCCRFVSCGSSICCMTCSSLFSFYVADIPRPTEPVKQVCYADDLTVWFQKDTACMRLECCRHLNKLCLHNPAPRDERGNSVCWASRTSLDAGWLCS